MGFRPGRLLALLVALAAMTASSASGAGVRVLFLGSGNRTDSNRTARTIDTIVIHATEGGFVGSVRWVRNPRSRGSAHYVVSRNGQVVQLVSTTDVAWHSATHGSTATRSGSSTRAGREAAASRPPSTAPRRGSWRTSRGGSTSRSTAGT
jgi:N-acetylmuramoyl-L-alanine amidase-like protein